MNIGSIKNLYDEVVFLIGNKRVAYFHLKSVKNFLMYIEDLPDDATKTDVKKKIVDYLIFIKDNSTSESLNSLDLFNNYIYPIGSIYESHLRFSIKLGLLDILLRLLVINTVICFVFYNIIANVTVTILVLLYYLRFYQKAKLGKVYSYRY